MTLRDVLREHLSWCPRFTTINVQTPTFGSLPLGGKAAVIILLAALGITSLISGYLGIPYFLQLTRATIGFDPAMISYFVEFVFPAIQGAVMLILLLDYVTSPTIRRRHGVELAVLLGLQIPRYWSIGLPDLFVTSLRGSPLGVDPLMLSIGIVSDIGLVAESLLGLYLIVRLLRGKAVLTKWTFLLVFAVFLSWFFLESVSTLINLSNLQFSASDFSLPRITNYLVLAAAALFSIRTFVALRDGRQFDLVLPLYLRVSVIFYALVYGGYHVLSSISSANLAFSFHLDIAASIALGAAFYIGLIAICIFPPKFVIGELGSKNWIDQPPVQS